MCVYMCMCVCTCVCIRVRVYMCVVCVHVGTHVTATQLYKQITQPNCYKYVVPNILVKGCQPYLVCLMIASPIWPRLL